MSCRIMLVMALLAVLLVPAPQPVRAQEPAGSIRLTPEAGATIRLRGHYPENPDVCPARQPGDLDAAYDGVLEIGRRPNGQLYLITELTFPEYLNGIAEVPRDWPLEALKAQVVAARTYAIRNLGPSDALARELNYDLCSTDACQVYRGREVKEGAWGKQWQQAVEETAGEILEFQGRPASTVYFSTSNGQTYSNADVFGSAPLPYLQPVVEEDDTESPVSNWQVRMPLSDLTETLRLGGWWPADKVIESVTQNGDNVLVGGQGETATMTLNQLRIRLNAQAVCLTPKRYPTAGASGRPYPQVIPSKWMTVTVEGADLVATGRGWGHGAGMVQWGLKGKADKGHDYAQMLGFYYGGLQPVKREEPGRIRVSLATDLEWIEIEPRGRVAVEGIEVGEGPFRLTGGAALTVQPAQPIPAKLRLDEVAYPDQADPAEELLFGFDLSAPARVRVEYRLGESEPARTQWRPFRSGPGDYAWTPADHLEKPGVYEVVLLAANGVDEVRSEPLELTVAAAEAEPTPEPEPSPETSAAGSSSPPALPIALGIAAVLFGLGFLGMGLYVHRRPKGRRSLD